jgi:predicted heme/steroid binding protein
MQARRFTLEELSLYDGRNGAPAYVAYAGIVYDVSRSYHWRGGRHWASHRAGSDLTAELADAPHGVENLARFPAVGILVSESGQAKRSKD